MAAPNTNALAVLVLAQNTAHNTRHPSVFEQICNYVWKLYRDSHDLPWTGDVENPASADVAGLGTTIHAAFVAAGVTAGTGGAAYYLEKIGNYVLTYPWNRIQDDATRSEQLARGDVDP